MCVRWPTNGYLFFSTKVTISRNRIAFNGGLGIQLGENGPDTNDAGDVDTGPNGFQNYPTLTSASPAGIKGNTSTFATGTYTIELFRSPTCDPSGHGEGLECHRDRTERHRHHNLGGKRDNNGAEADGDRAAKGSKTHGRGAPRRYG